jgi:aspartate kinase
MLSVLKIGGSVLRDDASFAEVAAFLHDRLAREASQRLVVIVSARHGVTDALLAEAVAIAPQPDAAALDLLWSTGETASVARLVLHLQARGTAAAAFNVHQTGLHVVDGAAAGVTAVRPLRLLAALGQSRVVVVPGFLGVTAGGGIATLGRGGSDLTAVLLAIALGADGCELVKDVAGYYTADPHADPSARQLRALSIDEAIEMAAAGCDLVQPAALSAARDAHLPLTVRCLDAASPVTCVHPRSHAHGIRHEDDSRRPAVGA